MKEVGNMHPRFIRAARARGWGGGPPWAGGGRGGRRPSAPPSASDAAAWFAGRLPEGWFTSAPEVRVDREEIVVIGDLPPLDQDFDDEAERSAAENGRIERFREDTRDERIEIAKQAEHRYDRKVAWGARI